MTPPPDADENVRERVNRKLDDLTEIAAHILMIRWMAQTVHQGYHQDQPGTWETCPRDICASAVAHLKGELKP